MTVLALLADGDIEIAALRAKGLDIVEVNPWPNFKALGKDDAPPGLSEVIISVPADSKAGVMRSLQWREKSKSHFHVPGNLGRNNMPSNGKMKIATVIGIVVSIVTAGLAIATPIIFSQLNRAHDTLAAADTTLKADVQRQLDEIKKNHEKTCEKVDANTKLNTETRRDVKTLLRMQECLMKYQGMQDWQIERSKIVSDSSDTGGSR